MCNLDVHLFPRIFLVVCNLDLHVFSYLDCKLKVVRIRGAKMENWSLPKKNLCNLAYNWGVENIGIAEKM